MDAIGLMVGFLIYHDDRSNTGSTVKEYGSELGFRVRVATIAEHQQLRQSCLTVRPQMFVNRSLTFEPLATAFSKTAYGVFCTLYNMGSKFFPTESPNCLQCFDPVGWAAGKLSGGMLV